MNEDYRSNAVVNALVAAADTRGASGLPMPLANEYNWMTRKARLCDWLDRVLVPAGQLRVCHDIADGVLQCSVYGGQVRAGDTDYAYAGAAEVDLEDDSDNYVYLTLADLAAGDSATVSQDGFPADGTPHLPLAIVTTADGEWDVDDAAKLVDCRPLALFNMAGAAAVPHRQTLADKAGDFTATAGGWGVGTLVLLGTEATGETQTNTLAFEFVLPPDYLAEGAVTLRVSAKYSGAGSNDGSTVDAEVWLLDDDGAVLGDLCATEALALTDAFADHDFTVTPNAGGTELSAGLRLMVLVRTAATEDGGMDPIRAEIGSLAMVLEEIQG